MEILSLGVQSFVFFIMRVIGICQEFGSIIVVCDIICCERMLKKSLERFLEDGIIRMERLIRCKYQERKKNLECFLYVELWGWLRKVVEGMIYCVVLLSGVVENIGSIRNLRSKLSKFFTCSELVEGFVLGKEG